MKEGLEKIIKKIILPKYPFIKDYDINVSTFSPAIGGSKKIAYQKFRVIYYVSPNEDGLFTTKLPVSGKTVKLKLLNLKDKMEIDQLIDSYPSERTAPVITTRLNKQIIAIDGDTDRNKIATFIEQMPIGDSKYIRRFMLDNEPRLDLKKEVKAPSGEKVIIDITFGVEFFRPFLSI
jgi:hypothetical protein